jgi:hypothetical protein
VVNIHEGAHQEDPFLRAWSVILIGQVIWSVANRKAGLSNQTSFIRRHFATRSQIDHLSAGSETAPLLDPESTLVPKYFDRSVKVNQCNPNF